MCASSDRKNKSVGTLATSSVSSSERAKSDGRRRSLQHGRRRDAFVLMSATVALAAAAAASWGPPLLSSSHAFQSIGIRRCARPPTPLSSSSSNSLHVRTPRHYYDSAAVDNRPGGPRWAVTDPDTLLRNDVKGGMFHTRQLDDLRTARFQDANENDRSRRPSGTSNKRVDPNNNFAADVDDIPSVKIPPSPMDRIAPGGSGRTKILFKRLKTKTGRVSKKKTNQPTRSNSSTMPGLRRHAKSTLKVHRTRRRSSGTAGISSFDMRKKIEEIYTKSASVPDSMLDFTQGIHNEERISHQEEVELGNRTQEAAKLQDTYEMLKEKLKRDPTDEEWCAASGKINVEALRQTIEEGIEAKNKLVTSNLRMVQGVVNLYLRNGLEGNHNAGDLMAEGILALIRAAEKFEPSRGFRFSTYAMYWIRAAVKVSHSNQSRIIHIPSRHYANHKRIVRTTDQLRAELGRSPTRKELCEAVDMSELSIERCLRAFRMETLSLDEALRNSNSIRSEDGYTVLQELIPTQPDDGSMKKMFWSNLRDELMESIHETLEPWEAEIMLLRFGLMDQKKMPPGFTGPLTIAKVCQLTGFKQDKVRRTIARCLGNLQDSLGHEWYQIWQYPE